MPNNTHVQVEIAQLNIHIVRQSQNASLRVEPTLVEEIKKAQHKDKDLMKIREQTRENKALFFRVDDKGTLWYKHRICVPKEGKF